MDGLFTFGERRELAEEAFNWLFVDFIPLLYEKRKVARQFQIEMWLDLTQLVKELNIEKTKKTKCTFRNELCGLETTSLKHFFKIFAVSIILVTSQRLNNCLLILFAEFFCYHFGNCATDEKVLAD